MTKPLHEMGKKEIQEALLDLVNNAVDHSEKDHVFAGWLAGYDTWQECPYTAIRLEVLEEGREKNPHVIYGFAKANWPDKWSAEFGENLALEKAVAKLAKQWAWGNQILDEIVEDISD